MVYSQYVRATTTQPNYWLHWTTTSTSCPLIEKLITAVTQGQQYTYTPQSPIPLTAQAITNECHKHHEAISILPKIPR